VFEKIVVGFDESQGSRDALALAAALGSRFGSEITVVTVVPSPIGGAFAPALPADAYTAVRSEAEASAGRAADEVGGNSVVVEALSPARGLDEAVEQTDADLLVLGCGKGDPGEVRAGHKARHMLQGGAAAVMLAPVGFADRSEADRALDRVGVAVDGSAESDEAIRSAIALARSGPLQILSVATDFAEYWGHWGATYAMAELAEASREAARNVLEAASKELPADLAFEEVLLEGDAAAELRRRSSDGIDLLCLGSRSFGPLRRVLLGSVSSDVVAGAGCAVLVVPRPAN
jgi:nucleotide-binding universal stress UspA family protein